MDQDDVRTQRPAPRRRMKAPARREQMIDVARQIFLEKGLEGARTKDIALACGVSESIIYRHFTSKEDIFEAAILEPLTHHLDEYARMTTDFAALSGRARVARSIEVHRAALQSMSRIAPLLGVALFADRANGRKFYSAKVAPLIDQGTALLRTALTGWAKDPGDPRFLYQSMFGTYFMLTVDAAMRDEPLDIDRLAIELTDLFNAAVSHLEEASDNQTR